MMLYPSVHGRLARAISREMEQCRINFNNLGRELELDLNNIYAPLLDQWATAGLVLSCWKGGASYCRMPTISST